MAAKKSKSLLSVVCLFGAVAGVLLAVAGVLWSIVGGGRMMYSDEDAQEYQEAYAEAHAATIAHGDDHGHAAPTEDRQSKVAAARERFDRARAKRDSARFAQNDLGFWLLGAGLAAAVAFGVGYVAASRDNE